MFEFKKYIFDKNNFTASFYYSGADGLNYKEVVKFKKTACDFSKIYTILDEALRLAFLLIGTSYYKATPTRNVKLPFKINNFQADFLNTVYTDGLSQFAYENHLNRENLAHFNAELQSARSDNLEYSGQGIFALQSGGKDSLLTASLLTREQKTWSALYISHSKKYPSIINDTGAEDVQVLERTIDIEKLQSGNHKNGHVPVTYINISIAIIQAILNHQNIILTSIGHEGEELHAVIPESENGAPKIIVNHQWSKTKEAEKLLQTYINQNISPKIKVYSMLRKYSELKIAELFVKNCWEKYGHVFSSCNKANYSQNTDNTELKWCGKCAKCANSYLLFAPFLKPANLDSFFPNQQSLFSVPELCDDFKGLLGIDGKIKPFECVGEIAELRRAYHLKSTGYPDLPFKVPDSNFNYDKTYT